LWFGGIGLGLIASAVASAVPCCSTVGGVAAAGVAVGAAEAAVGSASGSAGAFASSSGAGHIAQLVLLLHLLVLLLQHLRIEPNSSANMYDRYDTSLHEKLV